MYDGKDIIYSTDVCPHVNGQYKCIAMGCKNNDRVQFICPDIGAGYNTDIVLEHLEKRKKQIEKWNELIKIIPQEGRFNLKGIKCWKVHIFCMTSEWENYTKEEWMIEGRKLHNVGFELSFCEDTGIGNIEVEDDKFYIILWVYGTKDKIERENLDDCLNWIWAYMNKEE